MPSKRFTIRVGKRPQRTTSVRSQRAKRVSTLHAAAAARVSPKADADAAAAPEPAPTSSAHDPRPSSSAPHGQMPPMPPPPPAPPAKPKGLFKRLAARFRSNSSPAPPGVDSDFTDREARAAALRARGLLPPADLSAQEAARDARLSVLPDVRPPADDDGAPSAARLISERWRQRNAEGGAGADVEDPLAWEAASSDRAAEPTLAPLPPPPRKRLSNSSSAPVLSGGHATPPGSAASASFPLSAATAETFTTAREAPLSAASDSFALPEEDAPTPLATSVAFALPDDIALVTPAPAPATPKSSMRRAPPPPIVLTPSHPDVAVARSPSRVPLPPSPAPSLRSLGDLARAPLPPTPSSPRLLSPMSPPGSPRLPSPPGSPRMRVPGSPARADEGAPRLLAPGSPVRTRSDADGDAPLPSLCSSASAEDGAPPRSPTAASAPVLGAPLVAEPAPLPSVLEADDDDDAVAALPVPKASPRRKSTLLSLGRKLTTRRRDASAPLPKSPSTPTFRTPSGGGLARAPSTRLATTALHNRGSIYVQANAIKDDEERRLAELAFLDF